MEGRNEGRNEGRKGIKDTKREGKSDGDKKTEAMRERDGYGNSSGMTDK